MINIIGNLNEKKLESDEMKSTEGKRVIGYMVGGWNSCGEQIATSLQAI